MSASTSKKSFEFRMSKKVAELTQVVHMLFTRNHEKEVELEAIKEAYEYEIVQIMKDAKSQIANLESRLKASDQGQGGEQVKFVEQEMARREEEWKRKMAAIEEQLQEEKRECQGVRDLLIQAQMDIENLRDGQSTDMSRWNKEMDSKKKESERLKSQTQTLEKKLRESENQHSALQADLQKNNAKLQKENAQFKDTISEIEKFKDQLAARNKQLELEIRQLKKELGKKDRSARNSANSKSSEFADMSSATILEYAEEIERLRRQVQILRNELSNRENNFNRMFTEVNPVHVDHRGGSRRSSTASDPNIPHLRYARERAPSALGNNTVTTHLGMSVAPSAARSVVNVEEVEVKELPEAAPRAASASNSRLPNLGMDIRTRGMVRLVKPKPLPREMLSTKVGTHG